MRTSKLIRFIPIAALLLFAASAWAQTNTLLTYASGDLFLGFRQTGAANSLAVNIGPASQFLPTSLGGTNTNTAAYKVSFGVVPGTSTPVSNLATDLTTVFGASWTNNPTNGSGVRWAVVGFTDDSFANTPIGGLNARSTFVTRARTNPATQSTTLTYSDARLDFFAGQFVPFAYGTGQGSFSTSLSTTNSSVALIGSASAANNWNTKIQANGSFGLGSSHRVEQASLGNFTGPTDSVLDLYLAPYPGSTLVTNTTYLGSFRVTTAGELEFTPASTGPAPTITSFTPASGQIGASVSITGTGLAGATNVSFGGAGTTNLTITGGTNIATFVPPGATTGPIVVAATNGSATSSSNFTVLTSPTITSFTPASGPVGTSVVITGTGFTGATSVAFNSVNATTFTVDSATQITATVPASATTGKIAVTTPNGSVSSATDYTVTPVPVITSATSANGTVGVPFYYKITANNSPFSFDATPLPAGLSVNTSTGEITGTPTVASTFTLTLKATNVNGIGWTLLTLAIAPAPPAAPIITSATSATANLRTSFTYNITALNSPTSFNATGLPAGLKINRTTGVISGNPSRPGTFSVSLSAFNSSGTGTATLSIEVRPPAPKVSKGSPKNAAVGRSFSYAIKASNSPTSFNATGLPTGLSVNSSTGLITGTPTVSGNFDITVSASNASGTGTAALKLKVNPPAPVISGDGATRSGIVGSNFSYQVEANNAPTAYAAKGLPAGLRIAPKTGLISGKPTKAGSFTVSLSARNASGIGRATLNLIILAAP